MEMLKNHPSVQHKNWCLYEKNTQPLPFVGIKNINKPQH